MTALYLQEPGTILRKEQEHFLVTRGGTTLESLPAIHVDRVIVMSGGVQVTTRVIEFLSRQGIPLLYATPANRQAFIQVGTAHNNIPLLMQQARLIDDPPRALPLVWAVVAGKLVNQRELLQRYHDVWCVPVQPAIMTIDRAVQSSTQAGDADQLRGYEGHGAATYWAVWTATFEASWGFRGRAYRPPPDPLNALLSFGYTLLLHDLLIAVHGSGLNPYLGFFHTVEQGRPSLALDLEEEFRPCVVDALILQMVMDQQIGLSDLEPSASQPGAVYLNRAGRRRMIAAYEQRLQQRIVYPHPPFAGQAYRLRDVIRLQADQYARVVAGTAPAYLPLPWPTFLCEAP